MIQMPHLINWEAPHAKRIAALVVMVGFVAISIACCTQPSKKGVYDSTATIDKGACQSFLTALLICVRILAMSTL